MEVLTNLIEQPVTPAFESLLAELPEPQLAIGNLARWLQATGNPQLYYRELEGFPTVARVLVALLGASQPLTDSLIQNPELASLLFDPAELGRIPDVDAILREGRTILATATSPSHRLDRLRFLKQRWNLPIVINDLARTWPEEVVWQCLSDLAHALIILAAEAVWTDYSQSESISEPCPVMVVGFGKLGGRELNFSSDIDLVYVHDDALSEEMERHATRFCERFGRALSDRMGRGSVYRVDLRLRPYGNAGPIVASMRSVENYYNLYAEQWEVQALIRSKPMVGPEKLRERWTTLREARCFRPKLNELELEAMLAMKTRIEERADGGDIKRGAGGIRDVEFIVQVLQLLHGFKHESLREPSTCSGLRELMDIGLMETPDALALRTGYVFLRQFEHRCQLLGDQQTHSIPASERARGLLAHMMGSDSWGEVEQELNKHRRVIHSLYQSILQPHPPGSQPRDQITERLGKLAPTVLQWFDSLSGSEAFYESLAENRDSLDRVRQIVTVAPQLISDFKRSVAATELLVSGEIEEISIATDSFGESADLNPSDAADPYMQQRLVILAQWALGRQMDLGAALAQLMDRLLVTVAKRAGATYDLIALGSFGGSDLSPHSDADLVFIVENAADQPGAETQAQVFLGLVSQLKRRGANIEVDLRLRPDGGKGMLVRSHEALKNYDLSGMEMWERFALGQARLIHGRQESLQLIQKIAYGLPLDDARLAELLEMKKRIETERVQPQFTRRNVKLGIGGLNDLEWLVHLLELRFGPTEDFATRMADRITGLGRKGLFNAVEIEALQTAYRHLVEVRARLFLLCIEGDIIPENPDKLDRLGNAMSFESGNAFLAFHDQTIDKVRAIYLHTLERLKA